MRNLDRVGLRGPPRSVARRPADRELRASESFDRIVAHIAAGTVNAFYLHLSEGRRGDEVSTKEFQRFLDLGGATPATNIIHGSALTAEHVHEVGRRGLPPRVVAAVQPASLRRDDPGGEALSAGMPVALGRRLAAVRVDEPAGRAEGRAARARAAGAPDSRRGSRRHGHLGRRSGGRSRRAPRLHRGRPPSRSRSSSSGTTATPTRTSALPTRRGSTSSASAVTSPTRAPTGSTRCRAARAAATIEDLVAWGKPMRLDTGFQSPANAPSPSLTEIRALLTSAYPPVGPIFA